MRIRLVCRAQQKYNELFTFLLLWLLLFYALQRDIKASYISLEYTKDGPITAYTLPGLIADARRKVMST